MNDAGDAEFAGRAQPDSPDAAMLAALRAGDRSATQDLVRAHGPRLLVVANRLLRDRHLAEDCVQEAFISALAKLDQFAGRASFAAWLRRIVINQALMKLRSRKRMNEQPIDPLLPEFDNSGCRVEPPWTAPMSPEEIVARNDLRALVLERIGDLPDTYRIILQLRDIEELTTAEVAEALQLSEANVKVRLHRARAALKKLLEPILKGDHR